MDAVTPHITSVLQTYQASAPRSLHGPGRRRGPEVTPPAPTTVRPPAVAAASPAPAPLLLPSSGELGERGEARLEGERIACFGVGGERRLCLPQILTSVLTDFSLEQINRVCDELRIYCSRCTPEQLHELKASGVLPRAAPSCGLITQTDAERLCAALLHRAAGRTEQEPEAGSEDGVSVYHECFGGARGRLFARGLVRCVACGRMLPPHRFVAHSHGGERRTCHWGFDSARWPNLLLVAEDEPRPELARAMLDALAERPDPLPPSAPTAASAPSLHALKRKQVVETVVCKPEPPDSPPKKARCEDFGGYTVYFDPYLHYRASLSLSAFRPWGKREPVLQHPERVVTVANCTKFERDYQPNVALKPLTPPVDDVTSSTSPPPHVVDPDLAARLLDAEARLTERSRLLDEREAELARREAVLQEREAQLALRESEVVTNIKNENPDPNHSPPLQEADPNC